MGVARKIAGRYLFSGKSGSVINWISGISAAGMAIGTAALITILSVYNGFDGMIRDNLRKTDPDFLVRPAVGKTFDCTTDAFTQVSELPGVTGAYGVVEETIAVRYADNQAIARMRGIEDAWGCSVSNSLANELGIKTAFLNLLEMYYPGNAEQFSIMNPEASLERIAMRPKNILDLDGNVVVIPMSRARELIHNENTVTSFEIWCEAGDGPSIQKLRSMLGPDFEVLDRVMQQPSLYKMMRYEKAAIFLILMFVVLIVAFNIYGSLSMLIIEKKQDRETLRSMGASRKLIRSVFNKEGWMITWAGVAVGLAIGIVLVLCQSHFGLVKMPGNYLVQAYPVKLKFTDILLTLAGVGLIGALISAISIKEIDKDED